MRKSTLFQAFIVLVLCVVGLGFYRGWFVLSSSQGSSSGDNKLDINLAVDPDKAKEDAMTVESKARDIVSQPSNDAKTQEEQPSESK